MTDIDYDDPFLDIRYSIRRNYDEARRIREMVLKQVDAGYSRRDIARRLGMTHGTLEHWIRLARQERDGDPNRPNTDRLPYSH